MDNEQLIDPSKIKHQIQVHLDKAKELQNALELLLKVTQESTVSAKYSDKHKTDDLIKGTFSDIIKQIFTRENKPLIAKEALDLYRSSSGKEISNNTFSGQFSVASKKLLKKYTIMENPLQNRFYYGLPEWFEGDNLKQEYLEKIKPDRIQLF